MTTQVFLPCYFGNDLLIASEKLSTALFHSNWIEKSMKHKKAMIIFLENSKKPIKITAFGMVHIDFGTFSNICNSAYSLYAVLKKVNWY
jgi:odorant receptor